MDNTYTIKEAQARLPEVVRTAEAGKLVTITRHNKPVAHVISDERMGALIETIELMGDPCFMAELRRYRANWTQFTPLPSSGENPDPASEQKRIISE